MRKLNRGLGLLVIAGLLLGVFALPAAAQERIVLERGRWSTQYAYRNWESDTGLDGGGSLWTNEFYVRGRMYERPSDLRIVVDRASNRNNPRLNEPGRYTWRLRQATFRYRGALSRNQLLGLPFDDARFDLVLGDFSADVYDLANRMNIDYRDAGNFTVLRYVYLRGGDVIFRTGRISTQVLGGYTRAIDGNGDDRYPRSVVGGRFHMQVTPQFSFGLQGAQVMDDLDEIRRLSATANPLYNQQLAMTMFYQPALHWRIFAEGAMSSTDLNRTDGDEEKVQGEAFYLTSEYYRNNYGLTTTYERLSEDFYVPGNYASSVGMTPLTARVNDREKYNLSFWYRYADALDSTLRYNRWRNNLNNNPLESTFENEQFYGNARMRFGPRWMPSFSLTGSAANYDATTTSQYRGKAVQDRRITLGLSHAYWNMFTWRHSSSFASIDDGKNTLDDRDVATHITGATIRPADWVHFTLNHTYSKTTADTFIDNHEIQTMDYNVTFYPIDRFSVSASYTTVDDEQRHVDGTVTDNGYNNILLFANYYYNRYDENGNLLTISPYVSYYDATSAQGANNEDRYTAATLSANYRWAASGNEAYGMLRYRVDDRRGANQMDFETFEVQARYTMNLDFTGGGNAAYLARTGEGQVSEEMAESLRENGSGPLNYQLQQDRPQQNVAQGGSN